MRPAVRGPSVNQSAAPAVRGAGSSAPAVRHALKIVVGKFSRFSQESYSCFIVFGECIVSFFHEFHKSVNVAFVSSGKMKNETFEKIMRFIDLTALDDRFHELRALRELVRGLHPGTPRPCADHGVEPCGTPLLFIGARGNGGEGGAGGFSFLR